MPSPYVIDFGRPAEELVEELAAECHLSPLLREQLRECFARRLAAVEVVNGEPIRLYPFTRYPSDESPRLIVIDPQVRFGRPTVARTGMPVDVLFERYQAGDSVATLAEDYDLTTDEVEEAIRYATTPQPAQIQNPVR
jgi:uncharacterized protein (DUF433 family)